MKARFVKMVWENELRTIASFYFQPADDRPYRYEAGQYASLSLPHDNFDSRGYTRTMTLSSSPTEKYLKFTMRLLPTGGSSFKKALLALQLSDEITIFESMGDLVLPMDVTIPLVFIAGGVGIASFTGMTRWLLDNHEERDVALHYAVARPGDIALQQPFVDYAAWQTSLASPSFHPLTTSLHTPSVNKAYASENTVADVVFKLKRLTIADILNSSDLQSLFYVSGTQQFVEDICHGIEDAGIPRQQIVFDYFDGYGEL